MESLFRSTKVVLTSDFVHLFSVEELSSTLRDVGSVTGVEFSAVPNETNTTYALAGTWEQINAAYDFLEKYVEKNIRIHTNPAITPEENNKDKLSDQSKKDPEKIGINFNCITSREREANISNDELNPRGNSELNEELKMPENPKSQKITVESEPIIEKNQFVPRKNLHKSIIKSKSYRKPSKKEELCGAKDNADKIKNHNAKNNCKLSSVTKTSPLKIISINKNDDGKADNCNGDILSAGEMSDNESIKESTNKGKGKTKKPGDQGYWSRVKINNYNEQHKCEHCEVVLKSRKRYMEHQRRIHIKEFQCKVCQRRFGYPTDLHRHKCVGIPDPKNEHKRKGGRPKKEKSTETIFLPCPECDYIGTSRKRFNGHVRRTHRLTFKCDQCSKKFGFVRDLQRHKENVHAGPSHFCDKCTKTYKSKAVFELHLKTHEEGYEKPKYECQVCGKIFSTKYLLTTHVKTDHLGIKKTYLCQVCGKSFKQRNSYKQHSNAHAGIKPYVCDVCGKAFTYHKSLKEHKFMHDSIRRFQCQMCMKTFRQRTTLQIHMKVHKTVKDHICGTCGKGFSQKQALERHERIHTGVKPYTCIPCQRKFGDSSTIRRHMLAIHQKNESNWREDIVCNLKRRTDYYVTGGSGHNRAFKSLKNDVKAKPCNSDKTVTSESSTNPEPKYQTLNNVDTALLMLATTGPSVDFSNTGTFVPSTTLTGLDQRQIQSLSDSYQVGQSNRSHTHVNPPQYSVPSSQCHQQQINTNGALSTNLSSQIVNVNGLGQIKLEQNSQVGKIIFPLTGQQSGFQQHQQQHQDQQQLNTQQQQTVGQNGSVLSDTTLYSMASVADSNSSGQPGMSGEAVLSQAMANIWGYVGYPAFQSTQNCSNVTNIHYQTPQNH